VPNLLSNCARAALPAIALCLSAAHGTEAQPAPDSLGSALFSPFAEGGPARESTPSKTSPAPRERDPDLTMTLAASLAGVVAAVWLLRRL
jgi:hypothetical protein